MDTQKRQELEPPFAMLDRYYRALDRWDLADLIDCFSDDATYGHPFVKNWRPELKEPFVRGRDTIRRFLIEARKPQDSTHRITGVGKLSLVADTEFLERGDYYFASVTGRTANLLASCCALFQVDGENRIQRYAPHMGSPYYNLPTSQDYIAKYTPLM